MWLSLVLETHLVLRVGNRHPLSKRTENVIQEMLGRALDRCPWGHSV